jgi:hypothetical protein
MNTTTLNLTLQLLAESGVDHYVENTGGGCMAVVVPLTETPTTVVITDGEAAGEFATVGVYFDGAWEDTGEADEIAGVRTVHDIVTVLHNITVNNTDPFNNVEAI